MGSVLGFVAHHALDPHDIAGPVAGVAPGVVDAAVGFPVLDGDTFGAGDRVGAAGAEAGQVGQVSDPVGIPPVGT